MGLATMNYADAYSRFGQAAGGALAGIGHAGQTFIDASNILKKKTAITSALREEMQSRGYKKPQIERTLKLAGELDDPKELQAKVAEFGQALQAWDKYQVGQKPTFGMSAKAYWDMFVQQEVVSEVQSQKAGVESQLAAQKRRSDLEKAALAQGIVAPGVGEALGVEPGVTPAQRTRERQAGVAERQARTAERRAGISEREQRLQQEVQQFKTEMDIAKTENDILSTRATIAAKLSQLDRNWAQMDKATRKDPMAKDEHDRMRESLQDALKEAKLKQSEFRSRMARQRGEATRTGQIEEARELVGPRTTERLESELTAGQTDLGPARREVLAETAREFALRPGEVTGQEAPRTQGILGRERPVVPARTLTAQQAEAIKWLNSPEGKASDKRDNVIAVLGTDIPNIETYLTR